MNGWGLRRILAPVFGVLLVTVLTPAAQGQTGSVVTSPKNGTTVSPQGIQFSWTTVTGGLNYTLWIGSTPRAQDVLYYSTADTNNPTGVTSTTANLKPATTYYATLWTLTANGYTASASTFQTSSVSYLSTPANGAMVAPQNVQFNWGAVPGAVNYTIWLGSTPGAQDLFYYSTAETSNPAGTTSMTATLQPGTTYYATLWLLNPNGRYTESTSTFATSSALTSPANGATVSAQNAQFAWTTAPGALNYTLWLGSTPGAQDVLYYSTADTNNPTGVTSTTANLKPATTYYATLWTQTASGHTESASTFQTSSVSYLSTPANGTMVAPQNVQFNWSAVPGGVNYTIWLGSTPGAQDLLYYSTAGTSNPAGTTSMTATLQPGTTYYATLWTQNPGGGYTNSISTFVTSSALTSPSNGATVSAQNVQFAWTTAPGGLNYTLWLGSTPGAKDVLYYSTADTNNPTGITSTTANLKPATTYYATLWTQTASGHTESASTFQTSSVSYLSTPANGTMVAPQNVQFNWSAVPGGLNYTIWLGSTPGAQDLLFYSTAGTSNPAGTTSMTATLQPGTTYYATLWTQNPGGGYTNSISTFVTSSALTSPSNGATVSAQNVQFAWTTAPGGLNYTLWLGSTPGAKDVLYYSTADTNNPTGITSTMASLNPATTYYATLWTRTASGYTESTSTFQTSSVSYLSTPANGTMVAPQNVQFNWSAVPGGVNYTIWLGSTPGAQDLLFYSTAGTSNPAGTTSMTATLQPGTTYYATLWTQNPGGGYTNSTSTFATSSALTSPANGATVSAQDVQFAWTTAPGALNYTLWLGSTPGAKDLLYYSTADTNNPTGITSTMASLNPATTYYATLWTRTASGYTESTSTFQTSGGAVLISPANGAANLDPSVPIFVSWTPVSGATSYELILGSSAGANNYYDSGAVTTTSVSVTLNPNTVYYARVLTNAWGTVVYTDSTFSTGYALAHLTYPLNNATGVSQFLPFTWSQPQGATGYILAVSLNSDLSSPFFWSGIGSYLIPTYTSQYVWSLEPDTTYYVELCTLDPSPAPVECVDTSFTTGGALSPPSSQGQFYQTVNSLTAQVNAMAQGTSQLAIAGTPLYQEMLSIAENPAQPAECGDYVSTLLDLLSQNNIMARLRSISLDGIDGHVVAEVWDPFTQQWDVTDPFFGVSYFNSNLTAGQSAEQISALLLAGNYSSINASFVTPYGSQLMTSYFLDPMTYYTNVVPAGEISASVVVNYVPNSPLQFLNEVDLGAEGQAGFYAFNFQNQTDSVTVQEQGSSVTITPANTEGWAVSAYLPAGWTINSAPAGMRIFTFVKVIY